MPKSNEIRHGDMQGSDEGAHEWGANYDESQLRVPSPRSSASRLVTSATIVAKAHQCEEGSYIDSRWNLNVGTPLLKFVQGGSRKITHKAMTGKMTTSLKGFDPVAADTNARPRKQSGKVTMGLFLEIEGLSKTVEEKLNTVYDGKASVNPREQTDLRHLPAACFFETSATQPEQDSVAEWGSEMGRQVAAVHHRLSDFLDVKYYDLNNPLEDASNTDFHDD
ncbi:hypothetical protein MY5147_002929 [Beauveria neobassiana]